MNEPTNLTPAGESPFDRIRHVDEHGEYWLARELQALAGYETWRRFQEVVERARASVSLIQGDETAEEHFSLVTELVRSGNLGDQRKQDYRLTRFGSYLVAMAGDDTKEQVAAARVYFAVRTRQAEVAEAGQAFQLPRTHAEALRQLADSLEREEAQAKELEAARPKVEFFDQYVDAAGNYKIGDVAKVLAIPGLGQNKLFALLRLEGVLMGGGKSRNVPYQRHVDAGRFVLKVTRYDRADGLPGSSCTPYATPKGLDYIRKMVASLGYGPPMDGGVVQQ